MQVRLIAKTELPIDVMYTACRTCYSKLDAGELWETIYDEDKMKELIFKVLSSGHHSIAEHIQLTFTIDGISRKTSHQLVRHRHATYSQKSQRYVTYYQPFTYNIADSIKNNSDMLDKYNKYMSNCQDFYNEMIKCGIDAEDARDIFPNACHTSIIMSLNLRSFIHLCNERLCQRAQTEIREMTQLMVDNILTHKDFQFLKPFFKPKCKTCTEADKCTK